MDQDKSACFMQQMCGDAEQESQGLNLFLDGSKGESLSISFQKTEAKRMFTKIAAGKSNSKGLLGVNGAGAEAPKGCRRIRDVPTNPFGVPVGETGS